MIGYAMVGTNDLEKANAFYSNLFAEFGYVRTWGMDRFHFYGEEGTMGSFGVTQPFDGESSTVGNGSMVALAAKNREQVDKVHAKAMELGGKCEGEPGPRGPEDMNFYAAYFRDLDGNKLNVFYVGA